MATHKTPLKKADDPKMPDAIFVRSLAPSFRRAGFEFTREGIGLRLEDLTEEQLKAIEAEPLLSVQYIQEPCLAEFCAELVEQAETSAE